MNLQSDANNYVSAVKLNKSKGPEVVAFISKSTVVKFSTRERSNEEMA
jgi:hypothetical protein